MAALGIFLGAFPAFCADTVAIQPSEAGPFPDIKYKDAREQSRQLAQDTGKLIIVHFWATWCVPCVGELPDLDKVQKAYGSKGLKVIDISEDGTSRMPIVQSFFTIHGISNLTPYIDFDNDAFHAARARGLPTSYFVDSKGRQIAMAEGPVGWQSKEVKDFIEAQLK